MLVRMLATFAPSNCSTARLIWILLAFGATWNTMVRPSSRRIDVFSVMSGRRMMSVCFICFAGRLRASGFGLQQVLAGAWSLESGALTQRLLQFLDRPSGGHHAI